MDTIGGEPADGGQHDLFHDAPVHGIRDDGRGRVGAHTARVRTAVAVIPGLVVLGACERHDARAVDERDEARFFAGEELFDDDFGAGGTEDAVLENAIERLGGLVDALRDDDSFPRCEAVGLDHDRRTQSRRIGSRFREARERPIGRRGYRMPREEVLRIGLRALEPCSGGRRSEALQAARGEAVDDAGDER